MRSEQLLRFYRSLIFQPFSVVDVETTGSIAYKERVTEISVLHASLKDGIQHQATTLVNPEKAIPLKIVEITGITQAMVNAAPMAEEVFPEYLPLLNNGILTGHNLAFDYAFLKAEYRRLEVPFARPAAERLCTVQLARLMLPDLPSRSLPDLVRHFQFPVAESHRAEADAIACWLLAKQLLTEIHEAPDQMILERFGREWIPLKLAARILECSQKKAQKDLEEAGILFRPSARSGTPMYRRGEVERLGIRPII
jgi:DNA polymerase-3 subunit epsilon